MALIAKRLKKKIPWWTKIVGKIILSRIPVDGSVWQKVGLFVPGDMLDPNYVISTYNMHLLGFPLAHERISYLELGPGDSLATCIVAWAYGAANGYLIDNGAYASNDISEYYPLIEKLILLNPKRDVRSLMDCENTNELLEATHCRYMQNGLESLQTIKGDCIDFVFSQAVLEHVRASQFHIVCKELYRIQKPSGIGSHQIDFKDHLGGSLNSLRFSQDLWERDWFALRSGFYTNRMRLSRVLSKFEAAGFSVQVFKAEIWDKSPLPRSKLSSDFSKIDDADLLTKGANIIVKKPSC